MEESSYTHLREEIAHSVTHGIGTVLAIAGMGILIAHARACGSTRHIVCCSIFGASLIILYLASTLYHGIQHPKAKEYSEDSRSFGNLSSHCRYVHAFYLSEPAGSLGMVSLRGCLGSRFPGDCPPSFTAAKIFLSTAYSLYHDGVGGSSGYQAFGCFCSAGRTHPYRNRRLDVYCRNYFLSVAPIAVSPRHLASVRAVRQHPALWCGFFIHEYL